MNANDSAMKGFYKNTIEERLKKVQEFSELTQEELEILKKSGNTQQNLLNTISENMIGHFELPLGIATNFKINKKDYLIPMVTEESSVIAAASKGAKIARKHGGFTSAPVESIMIGQIEITNIITHEHRKKIKKLIKEHKQSLITLANDTDPVLKKLGGGVQDIITRKIQSELHTMLIIHLLVDVKDAMGANTVNTMVERVAKELYTYQIIKNSSTINLRIISNLSTHRIARAKAIFDKDLLGGSEVVNRIVDAYHFAKVDPFRSATHNKGILNGISALALATGNDTRAIEAGAHAYAATHKGDLYSPLSRFYKNIDGHLVGEIELPLPMAIIGGITDKHPIAKIALKILGVKTASELSQVAAALGLAQNVAALRALVDEGIQYGHMKLHKRKEHQP